MTHDDRVQATAVIALLAALLGALWALQHGYDLQGVAVTSALAYGAALAFTGPLQAPLGAAVVTSIKYTAFTAAFTVWIAATGVYSGWQLLRGRTSSKGAFA